MSIRPSRHQKVPPWPIAVATLPAEAAHASDDHHETRYRHERPVIFQPHVRIVTPRDRGDLTTISRSLRCEPHADVAWSLDVFGNLIATATFAGPTSELSIIAEATIEHRAPEWPIFAIEPSVHAYPSPIRSTKSSTSQRSRSPTG